MPLCCIAGCDREISPRSSLKACHLCRQNMHYWEKRRPSEILNRAEKLHLYSSRMAQFAQIDDDEVTKLSHQVLQEKGIMKFKDVKRRAKSYATQVKIRQAKAKPANNGRTGS